jgi:hypothetical protein
MFHDGMMAIKPPFYKNIRQKANGKL